jgi:hypothetical protein
LLVRKSLPNDGAMEAGVIDSVPAGEGSAGLKSVVPITAGAVSDIDGASGRTVATRAFGETEVVAEAAFAVELEAGVRRPSAASADGPKNTNSMAATATLTSLPLT